MEQSFRDSENYNIKSGEIFLTLTGDITIHCTLCEKKCDNFLEYTIHVDDEHLPIIEVKLASDSDLFKEEQEDEGYENSNKLNDLEIDSTLLVEEEPLCENIRVDDNEIKGEYKLGPQAAKKRIQHDYDGLNYKCKMCNFACKMYKNLVGHVKRHSGHRPHQCTECGKGFFTRFELKTHTRSHTGERPFLCNECGQSFITSGKLADHMKRHNNEKNYQCTVCNRKFFNTQNLRRHLAVHSSERCYECLVCQASFKRLTALTNHRKLHDNKREYHCEKCPAKFNQRPGLYSHLKSKHSISQEASLKTLEEQIEVVF